MRHDTAHKLLLACSLFVAMLASPALAQRSDSYKAIGATRVDACKAAKDRARAYFDGRSSSQRALNMDQRVKVSDCDCSEDRSVNANPWVCIVDAEITGVDNTIPSAPGGPSSSGRGGVRSDEAKGASQQEACVDAKDKARRAVSSLGGTVKGYSACNCSSDGSAISMYRWQCMVDTSY